MGGQLKNYYIKKILLMVPDAVAHQSFCSGACLLIPGKSSFVSLLLYKVNELFRCE
jgi:hypothetical protein